MTNISSEESKFYQSVADRLEVDVEEAKAAILKEIQEKMNQGQN